MKVKIIMIKINLIKIINQVRIKILNKIIQMRIKMMKQIKNNLKYSFVFPMILSNLNINVTDHDTSLAHFSYGVFILSLIALLCFINIIGYIIGYYIIQNGKYEIKYPKLSRFITFYKQSTTIFIVIETLMCLICLLLLVIFSLLYVYSSINK